MIYAVLKIEACEVMHIFKLHMAYLCMYQYLLIEQQTAQLTHKQGGTTKPPNLDDFLVASGRIY